MATAQLPPAENLIEQVLRQADGISTLPHIALQLVAIASSPDATAGEVERALEADPPLCARVIRFVNSASLGLRSKVSNLRLAIALVGVKTVRDLAVAASVGGIFQQSRRIGPYRRDRLWTHLVAVGIGARLLATRNRLPQAEDAFLAGLLHDIGIVLEEQFLEREFAEIMTSQRLSAGTLAAAERERLGFDHTLLGLRFAELWRLPKTIATAIRFHHCARAYNGPELAIVRCVEVANFACSHDGMSSVGLNLLQPVDHAMQGLGMTVSDLPQFTQDIRDELARHPALLAP